MAERGIEIRKPIAMLAKVFLFLFGIVALSRIGVRDPS